MAVEIKKYIRIFKLPQDRHQKVINQISEETNADLDFYTLSIFATIIITLGLILNNNAVVIGGVLLTPLVWPMLAIALGMVRGSIRLFEKGLFNIIKILLLTLVISYLIGLISPFKEVGTEILTRTQPTILELIIALVAGFMAAFVISYPKKSSFIAGIVIAAAVVPPLCVIGISFAHNNLEQAAGAFLLFIANIIAVVLSAAFFFYLAHFKQLESDIVKERRKGHFIWTIVFLIVILIPLLIITKSTIKQENRYRLTRQVIITNIDEASLIELVIKEKENTLYIATTLRARNNLNSREMDRLISLLSDNLESSVNLQVTVIPTLQGGKIIEEEVVNEQKNENNGDVFPNLNK